MNSEELNRLIDSTFDLEGMLMLLKSRPDDENLLSRVRQKAVKLTDLINESFDLAEEEPVADGDLFYEIGEYQMDDDDDCTRMDSEIHRTEEQCIVEESDTDDDSEEVDDEEDIEEDDEIEEITSIDKQSEASANESATVLHENKMRKPISFSINDRFRFKRELFGNSESDFKRAVDRINSAGSYEDVERYIICDCRLDLEAPEVVEFMEIIKKHFD